MAQLLTRTDGPARAVRRALGRRRAYAHLRLPPALPSGWTVAPPDFVGVGVQRAGTSWWYSMIERHPRVFHAPGLPKELHYFDRFWQDEFTQHDARAYAEFFPRPDGGFSGEWTPRYIHDFWTLALLRAAAPETKLIVLLRDPVERYLSGLAHEATRGIGSSPQVAGESWQRGFYHRQLQRLYDAFPARQILVLQFERCLAQAESELQRTYRFLGLDDEGFLPDLLTQPVNASTAPKPHMPEHVRRQLAATYQADVRMLEADGHIDSSLWPNFGSQRLRDG